jgi:hypothetical protein
MRFLSTKAHGVIDYLVGLLLIAVPWIFGFAQGGMETWIFVLAGVGALIYSLFTKYEMGVVKVIPMPMHLLLDALSGIVLAASPWIFGFSDVVYLPHLLFGLFEIGASLITQKVPGHRTSAAIDRR